MEKSMETNLCSNCVCFPVCKNYTTAGPVISCRYVHPRRERSRWKLLDGGKGICRRCNFVQNGVWDYDHHQRFCGVCGAEMDLEEYNAVDKCE